MARAGATAVKATLACLDEAELIDLTRALIRIPREAVLEFLRNRNGELGEKRRRKVAIRNYVKGPKLKSETVSVSRSAPATEENLLRWLHSIS